MLLVVYLKKAKEVSYGQAYSISLYVFTLLILLNTIAAFFLESIGFWIGLIVFLVLLWINIQKGESEEK
jgi:hypothetical protein